MTLRIMENAAEIAVAAGEIFVSQLKNNPESVLGLATGASPVETYKYLISQYRCGYISFAGVKTVNLDEYCSLAREDSNSYWSFMHDNLFNFVDIKEENVHLLDGNAPDAKAECAGYDLLIDSLGGIDVQLLGIGTNGHIGFNEPADAFTQGTFRVKLTDSTVKSNSVYFPDGNMPRYALTMGIGSIMKARKIVLIATGEAKAKAVKALVRGDVTPDCPASILQNHTDAIIFVDKAAACLL